MTVKTKRACVRLPKNNLGYHAERMNKLESRYAELLEKKRLLHEISFWRFEEIKFRLADKTWYTPDFYIVFTDGHIEIHETKGFVRDDANVKIKAAAEKFPEITFVMIKWLKNQWVQHNFRDYSNN